MKTRNYISRVFDLVDKDGSNNLSTSDIISGMSEALDYCKVYFNDLDIDVIRSYYDFVLDSYCYVNEVDFCFKLKLAMDKYQRLYISNIYDRVIDFKYTFTCCLFGYLMHKNEVYLGYKK
jgi:hypothetical protein